MKLKYKTTSVQIVVNLVSQIGSRVITILVGIVTLSVLTRYLGPEYYGVYSIIFVYLSLFSELSDLGLNLLTVRNFSGEFKKEAISSYISTKLLLITGSTLIALAALVFVPYSPLTKLSIVAGSVAVFFSYLGSFGAALLQTRLRLDKVAFIEALNKIINLVLILLFVYLRVGLLFIVGSVVVSNILSLAVTALFVRQHFDITPVFNLKQSRDVIQQSLPIGIVSLISLLQFKIDSFMLSVMTSAAEVGVYSLAFRIFENILVFWGLFMASIFPLLARYKSLQQSEKFDRIYNSSFVILIMFSLAVATIGILLAPIIIRLTGGSQYGASVMPLRILLLSVPFLLLNNLIYHRFLAIGEVTRLLYVILFSLFFNMTTNYVAIRSYGIVGAAVTTLATAVVVTVGYSIMDRKTVYEKKE